MIEQSKLIRYRRGQMVIDWELIWEKGLLKDPVGATSLYQSRMDTRDPFLVG